MTRSLPCLATALLIALSAGALSEDADEVRDLTFAQEQVRARMLELEQRVLEVADLIEEERPEVAGRLRLALAESRQRFIVAKMATVRSLLAQEDYGGAAERQRGLLRDLAALASLLDPAQAAEELAMLRRAAERIGALAERQASAAERTRRMAEGGPASDDAMSEQAAIRRGVALLLDEVLGAPGSDHLAAALRRMAAAEAALAVARHEDALAEQMVALQELNDALAEVNDAIRRLEEGSVEGTRVLIRQILEEMLNIQMAVRLETVALVERHSATAQSGRAFRLAAADLGRRQAQLIPLGTEARDLVEQGGGSPSLFAGLSSLLVDVSSCADRLGDGLADRSVAELQGDVESVLKSLLAALAGEMFGPGEAEPADPRDRERDEARRLLGAHAELRVLGDLQAALLARTVRVERAREPDGGLAPAAAAEAARIGQAQAGITGALHSIDAALQESGMP
jgi:hypothetical protein